MTTSADSASPGELRVLLAAPRAFCAGVTRAIQTVEALLERHDAPVYVRHQIVHNDVVVQRLERLGARFVEDERRRARRRRLAAGQGRVKSENVTIKHRRSLASAMNAAAGARFLHL
jgi:4-hydroxy-3-methylbut-2-enyl diphosphate reductase IspH